MDQHLIGLVSVLVRYDAKPADVFKFHSSNGAQVLPMGHHRNAQKPHVLAS
jgi:hypothetical protein